MPQSRPMDVQTMLSGERYVGRCVSEHADAVTDKELVYHVIEGADEHRDDARNRKTPQKES